MLGITDRTARAAFFIDQITNADRAFVHKTAVARLHASVIIPFRKANAFICLRFDRFIDRLILRTPTRGLIAARDHQDKTNLRKLIGC